MDRNPLQAVATMKVMKLNQIRGMESMFITETFLVPDERLRPDFSLRTGKKSA